MEIVFGQIYVFNALSLSCILTKDDVLKSTLFVQVLRSVFITSISESAGVNFICDRRISNDPLCALPH